MVGTTAGPLGHIIPSGNDLQIGHDPVNPSRYFNGLIDEPTVYNTALSADQIEAIYSAGSAGKCLAPPIAPYFEADPAGRTVGQGATVSFVAIAGGTSPLSYQWQFNGFNIAGATTTMLTLTDVQPSQAGDYSLVASNTAGSVTSSNAVLVVNSTSACAPVPVGLVGWWAGQGNANDNTTTNNGVLEGGMSFVPGEVGEAFSFNGIDADVRIPASASLNVGTGPGLTIEAWIRPGDLDTQRPVVEWNDGSFGVHLWVNVPVSGNGGGPGSLWVDIKDIGLTDHVIISGGGLLDTSTFKHVAATYDKARGNVILYVDGVVVAHAQIGSLTPRTIGDFYFGLRPYRWWRGDKVLRGGR